MLQAWIVLYEFCELAKNLRLIISLSLPIENTIPGEIKALQFSVFTEYLKQWQEVWRVNLVPAYIEGN